MRILPKHTMNRERGQTTAEFVLIAPFLFLLFFLMVDFGWMLKNWIVVTNTAREVDRCAIVDNCALNGTPVAPQTLGYDRLTAGLTTNLTQPNVTLCYIDQPPPGGGSADGKLDAGDSLVVTVSGNNQYISPVIPFLRMISGGGSSALPDPLPIKAQEEMLLERTPSFSPTPAPCP